MKLGPYELGPNDTLENGIYTGDARELAPLIPDESVDLIFTDPVYQNIEDYHWLAETAARVLRSDSALLAWQGTAHLPKALDALCPLLDYKWVFSMSHSNAMIGNIIFSLGIFTHWTPLIWCAKGNSKPIRKVRDYVDVPLLSGAIENHDWHKSVKGVAYWLKSFASSGAVVFDPFTGGGTVPAVCKMLGRRWLAFEIDPAVAEQARERVQMTQPPLFVPQPEQVEMAL